MKKIIVLFLLLFAFLFADNSTKKIYLFYSNDVHGGITEVEATFLNPNFPPVLGVALLLQPL